MGFWTSKSTKEMLSYIGKRLILLVFTFIVIFLICFVLVRLLPVAVDSGMKDPEIFYRQMVAQGRYVQNSDGSYSPMPVLQQLWNFILNLFSGNGKPWGFSYHIQWLSSPSDILGSHLTPTVLINIYSMLISIPVGLGLGIFMALKKNKWQDQVISTGVMIFISVPSFVYAFLVQYLLCFKAGWFPITMNAGTNYFSPTMFRSMIPAVLSLSFGSIAGYARYTRAELTEVLTSDYLLLARTKGLTKAQATVRHALRNAMVPIFPSIVAEFISVMSGSLIIESIFGVPGVGGMYLAAINSQDYDAFMFLSGFYILISLVAGIVVDLSYGIIDPRIRMGAR